MSVLSDLLTAFFSHFDSHRADFNYVSQKKKSLEDRIINYVFATCLSCLSPSLFCLSSLFLSLLLLTHRVQIHPLDTEHLRISKGYMAYTDNFSCFLPPLSLSRIIILLYSSNTRSSFEMRLL